MKTYTQLVERAESHKETDVSTMGGHEFDSGVAYADMQWLTAIQATETPAHQAYVNAHRLVNIEILMGRNRRLEIEVERLKDELERKKDE